MFQRRPISSFLTSWQHTHGTRLQVLSTSHRNHYAGRSPQLSELTYEYPGSVVAASLALGSGVIPWHLHTIESRMKSSSISVPDEQTAQSIFKEVLSHYDINDAPIELQCMHLRQTHTIVRVADRYHLYLYMHNKPTVADMQHQILHYVTDGSPLEAEGRPLHAIASAWHDYFTSYAPSVIEQVCDDPIR